MAVPQDYENLAPYQEELCHEWRPARLDYVARVGRGLGLDARARLRICDLACGAGLSVLLQAAAAPQHEVVGIDLNPTHIAQARRRAAEAGLANAHFHNRAIEETADLGLDEFDVVTMSGAYSWLAPQVRRAARAFVRRHLRPGGLFGLHMMTLPGWSSVEPLWKLAREFAAPAERDPRKRHAATVALLAALRGSAFMRNHPVAAGRVDKIAALAPEAFAHEYLTAHWRPEYFVDVARRLADDSGLVYVGDCKRLWRNAPALAAPRSAAPLLDGVADGDARETLLDYIVLALDRHALFHKGRIADGRPGVPGDVPFGSLGAFGPRPGAGMASGIGRVKLDDARYAAVLAAVAGRSLTAAGIVAAPACARLDRKQVVEAIGVLAAGEFLVPFAKPAAARDVSGADAFTLSEFNRRQMRRPVRAGTFVFASPVLGHGLPLGEIDARLLAAVVEAGRSGARDLLRRRFAGATMTRKGGATLEGEALLRHLDEQFAAFERDKLPKLAELEIALPA